MQKPPRSGRASSDTSSLKRMQQLAFNDNSGATNNRKEATKSGYFDKCNNLRYETGGGISVGIRVGEGSSHCSQRTSTGLEGLD